MEAETSVRIVFSTKVATKLSSEEMDELRVKALTEKEIETLVGKVVVVDRNFAGQDVKFVTFPEEVESSGVRVSVSPSVEKIPVEVIEEMVGHTIATAAKKAKDQVALRQEYDTEYGHFHTFAEFDPNGGTPIVYVGLASEIVEVQKHFQIRAKSNGQMVKTLVSPKARAAARRRKLKAEKKARKKS